MAARERYDIVVKRLANRLGLDYKTQTWSCASDRESVDTKLTLT